MEGLAYDEQKHVAIKVKKIKDMDLDELHEYFKINKHKSAWLWRQLYFRGGIDLIERFGEHEGWKRGTIEREKSYVGGL